MRPEHGYHFFTGYNSALKGTDRALRKNMTRQEKKLWYDYLRNTPEKWYRQRVIDHYIVDFFCYSARLIIELDGAQHFTAEGEEYDSVRTEILEQYQLAVLRFPNSVIDRNFRGICDLLEEKAAERMLCFS